MIRNYIRSLAASVALLVPLLLAAGCSDSGTSGTTSSVVVFTDVHFNPFYDPSLFPALNTGDASAWADIFRTSAVTAPSAWGGDTNFPLLALTLSSLRENRGNSRLILFTGDILGHNLPQQFYWQISNNTTTSSRDSSDVAAMKAFTDKTVAFFMQQVRAAAGDTPVLFALGNLDSYTGLGPDSSFLANTAELYYTQFLNGTVDHRTFIDSFTSGGYYAAEPAGTNLMVIGLNTFECSPSNAYFTTATTGPAVSAEFVWLDTALALAQAKGKKVWLLMHVPPGVDKYSTAQAVDANGHLPDVSAVTLLWDQGYQATFQQILAKYPGLVAQAFVAHTHMDEYRIISPGTVGITTPGIAPYFGNNPAYKIFTINDTTLKATDYTSLNYDLAAMPAQFSSYYTFSAAYQLQGDLTDSMTKLLPLLSTDSAKQQLYRGYYFSGHNYTTPDPSTLNYPITDKTWPVYWCGTGNVELQDFFTCVNSY